MTQQRHVIIRLEDAKALIPWLDGHAEWRALVARFEHELGGDILEIAMLLKKQPMCGPCVIEGMQRDCYSHRAQKLGRRLLRLVERAEPFSAEAEVKVCGDVDAGAFVETCPECHATRQAGRPHGYEAPR